MLSYIHSPSTRVDLARHAAATPRAAASAALFIDGDRPGRGAEAAFRKPWPEIERLRLPADLVVLTSLWPVDERATVELIRRFRARAEAPDGTQPFAHPAYWAPFVLVGEAAGGGR